MSTTTWRLCVKKPKPGATTGFDAMTEYLLVCPECLAEAQRPRCDGCWRAGGGGHNRRKRDATVWS